MKYLKSILSGLFLLSLIALFASCKNSTETKKAEQIDETGNVQYENIILEPSDFASRMKQSDAVIVDLRFPPEYEEGHIENAINVNFFDPNFQSNILELDKSKTYFLYGKGEAPTKRAAIYMKQKGFSAVYTIKGGYEAWTGLNQK